MSEPDVGSDLGNISCRARKDGDSWVINGNKYWCTFADGADYIMLVARTSDSPDPKRKHVGLSSFLIEKPRGTLPPGVVNDSGPIVSQPHSMSRTFSGPSASPWTITAKARPARCRG